MSVARVSNARLKICATRSGEAGGRGDLLELVADIALALGSVEWMVNLWRESQCRGGRRVIGLLVLRGDSPGSRRRGVKIVDGVRRGRAVQALVEWRGLAAVGLDERYLLDQDRVEAIFREQLEFEDRLAEVEIVFLAILLDGQ